jgi:hypothetical protein
MCEGVQNIVDPRENGNIEVVPREDLNGLINPLVPFFPLLSDPFFQNVEVYVWCPRISIEDCEDD